MYFMNDRHRWQFTVSVIAFRLVINSCKNGSSADQEIWIWEYEVVVQYCPSCCAYCIR